jgi:glycine cleavage system aminomethyltransferase T
MAKKLTETQKAELAEMRIKGFAVESLVTVREDGQDVFGSVIASNGYITSVLTYSPQLGKVITRSWGTRGVKPARFVF